MSIQLQYLLAKRKFLGVSVQESEFHQLAENVYFQREELIDEQIDIGF